MYHIFFFCDLDIVSQLLYYYATGNPLSYYPIASKDHKHGMLPKKRN